MSKLDDILGEIKYSTIDGMERLTPYYTKEAKQQIKELFLELVGDTSGINPNNEDFYNGYTLAQDEIRDRVREL